MRHLSAVDLRGQLRLEFVGEPIETGVGHRVDQAKRHVEAHLGKYGTMVSATVLTMARLRDSTMAILARRPTSRMLGGYTHYGYTHYGPTSCIQVYSLWLLYGYTH